MSRTSPAAARIRAQAASIHRKKREEDRWRCIAVRSTVPWDGEEIYPIEGRPYRFAQCDSALRVREALLGLGAEPDTDLVIVTNLDPSELGADVLARVAKRKLHSVDAWGTVVDMFGARSAAPTLRIRKWIADVLLEDAPPGGYPQVASGVLDEDTAWSFVLKNRLGLEAANPDARDLLRWTLQPGAPEALLAMPAERRAEIRRRIAESGGRASELILACVEAGRGADATAIGLACRAVFAVDRPEAVRDAAVRLEQFVGGLTVAIEPAVVWADAAAAVVDEIEGKADGALAAARLLDRSDQVLDELRAIDYAYLSVESPRGFEQRLERFAKGLAATLKDKPAVPPAELYTFAEQVRTHRLARRDPDRAARVDTAMRLLRWTLAGPAAAPASFADAALRYARDGGFVDWARRELAVGEESPGVAKVYRQLAALAARVRGDENTRFGALLAGWTEAGSPGDDVIRIEEVLTSVVARAARSAPTVLVVMDGMSFAVFRELLDDIAKKAWVEVGPEGEAWPKPAVAALPTVTKVSRTSLLCGRLATGDASTERAGFESHPELVSLSKTGKPPVLFHKASLAEATGFDLTEDVRDAIADPKRRIVGVVVNAVDDLLDKGMQTEGEWTLKRVPSLDRLLRAARDSGRLVVMTSDHGHVVDRGTELRKGDAGERFRTGGEPVGDGEVGLTGSRVVIPQGGTLIAPFREDVRYGSKKHGYHGGATPQECLVPVAVLSRFVDQPKGWVELPLYRPAWWDAPLAEGERAPVIARPVATTQTAGMPPLLAAVAEEEKRRSVSWIDDLLASGVYAAQRKLGGRTAPTEEVVRAFLTFMDERGGAALKPALANKLGIHEIRLGGLIAGLSRLFNVDGYPVVTYDEASDTVRFDRTLLTAQFELPSEKKDG